jgi:RES domain-containing protein
MEKNMSGFKSWRSYRHFEMSTKHQSRYIYDDSVNEFLNELIKTSKSRYEIIPKGANFWRAQLGCDYRPIIQEGEHIADEPCPLARERMKPKPKMANEGRANPKGIPYLYVATEKDTAMAEVRPWLGSKITVGNFRLIKDITLLNCSSQDELRYTFYFKEPSEEKREKKVWLDIDWAFSKPVGPNDSFVDYIPTQIIAELFKKQGLDGIAYRSNLGEGHNVVLYDLDVADIDKLFVFKTEKISYSFREEGTASYIVKEKKKGR